MDKWVSQVLLEVSADGLVVLDGQGRFVTLNSAAAHILGLSVGQLVGRDAPFDLGTAVDSEQQERLRGTWLAPDGRQRNLDYRLAPLTGGGYAVWFSDVTDALRQRERLTAIARAASSVADGFSLRATLDEVAREVAMTATIAAVQILAMDNPEDEVRLLGMAGFPEAADFTERLSACRSRGAEVLFMEAFLSRKPVVVRHRRAAIMTDPVWEPLHIIMSYPDWDSFVSMPLVARGRTLGVINAYYLPGEDPGPSSLAFLEAMADQAAVAIDIVSLVAQNRSRAQLDARRRLGRDLHDSVVQQLFSMRMQAAALRAQLDNLDAGPVGMRNGAQELADLAESALADLRALVFELRPLDLAEHGLIGAVRSHAESVAARTGLAISVHNATGPEWDAELDLQEDLCRIVQEALNNVVKHAHAASVDIHFARSERHRELTVDVIDDGSGPSRNVAASRTDVARHDTLGLVSMRERTENWGGQFVAGPNPAGGWKVSVAVPLHDMPSS
jgi:PAS domain S-box-containing protein